MKFFTSLQLFPELSSELICTVVVKNGLRLTNQQWSINLNLSTITVNRAYKFRVMIWPIFAFLYQGWGNFSICAILKKTLD